MYVRWDLRTKTCIHRYNCIYENKSMVWKEKKKMYKRTVFFFLLSWSFILSRSFICSPLVFTFCRITLWQKSSLTSDSIYLTHNHIFFCLIFAHIQYALCTLHEIANTFFNHHHFDTVVLHVTSAKNVKLFRFLIKFKRD